VSAGGQPSIGVCIAKSAAELINGSGRREKDSTGMPQVAKRTPTAAIGPLHVPVMTHSGSLCWCMGQGEPSAARMGQ